MGTLANCIRTSVYCNDCQAPLTEYPSTLWKARRPVSCPICQNELRAFEYGEALRRTCCTPSILMINSRTYCSKPCEDKAQVGMTPTLRVVN